LPTGDAASIARELGKDLFTALMDDPGIYACYHTSLAMARGQQKGLRIRLRIDAPELALLPWEYLYDSRQRETHLSLSVLTPVVRHLETALPIETLDLEPPIRVLGMVGYSAGLDAEGERRRLALSVEHLTDSGMLRLDWVHGHDWRSLLSALGTAPVHVFHFIGHGGFDEARREGFLELEGESGGGPQPLAARDLANLLERGHETPKLVVLNSCNGARGDAARITSSSAAIIASKGIPAVVSMQAEITDDAAKEFARAFYDFLSQGHAVDQAISQTRWAMKMALEPTIEWGTPVLHMRSQQGTLFRLSFAGAVRTPARRDDVRPSVLPSVAAPVSAAPRAAPLNKGLQLLAGRVRQYWIEGVLEPALARAARLEIGKDLVPELVASPWDDRSSHGDPGAGSIAEHRNCLEVYEQLGQSLLILGEPGTGKTMTLLELARDLLERRAPDSTAPLPVVFNLSSWAARRAALPDWLTEELSAKYLVPRKIARTWLAERRIVALLDGLDEVMAAARPACVETINTFIEGAQMAGLVVCCRVKEYFDVRPSLLALNGAVRLRQLSREQVFDYLERAGDRLAVLRRVLERDSGLLIEARTPLMLSLMVAVYADLVPEALDTAGAETLQQRRNRVMEDYVARSFRLAGVY